MDVYSQNAISQSKIGKSNIIKKIILPLFLTLTFLCISEKHLYGQRKYTFASGDNRSYGKESDPRDQYDYFQKARSTNIPPPHYNTSDLVARLNTYNFPASYLQTPLPITGPSIVQHISRNTGSNFNFLREDAIFLITILRVEEELQKLQKLVDSTLDKITPLVFDVYKNNSDLGADYDEWNGIVNSIEDIKTGRDITNSAGKLGQLDARRKELEAIMRPKIKKRGTMMAPMTYKLGEACAGARDLLLVMADLQKRLERTVTYDFSQEEKDIIKTDYEITKDMYERIHTLFKNTYRWEAKNGKRYLGRW